MAQNYQTIKTNSKITRKLSVAVGLLSFAAFVVQGLGQTWGFEGVGQQITQTALLFAGAVNIFFLGSTTQKEVTKKEGNNESAK